MLAYKNSIEYMAIDKFPGLKDHEDMIQIGYMGLLKAIDRLDISRVKSVDAWVYLNVRGAMLNAFAVKSQFRRRNHDSLENYYGIDEPYEIPMEIEFDNPAYADLLLKRLPEREAFIIRSIYFDDLKRTEVAKEMGVSSMRVGQLEQRALKFLSSIA